MTTLPSSERGLPFEAGSAQSKTLIVGLGNPILGDDGIGWRIAERVQARLGAEPERVQNPEVDCLALGGLSLMERLVGYQRVIIIDAITTHQNPPGTVTCFPLEALTEHATGHTTAAHDTSLKTAIAVGRSMGAVLPEAITIVAVEIEQIYDFSEELTPEVAAAITPAELMIFDIILHGGPS
jgi:hydrogenase maturation protease